MTTLYRLGLCLLVSLGAASVSGQQQSAQPAVTVSGNSTVKVTIPARQENNVKLPLGATGVVLSGTATTARIADPNEPVVFSGHVMRMADFVAAVSSSSAEVQRHRIPETHNRETVQPVPPL